MNHSRRLDWFSSLDRFSKEVFFAEEWTQKTTQYSLLPNIINDLYAELFEFKLKKLLQKATYPVIAIPKVGYQYQPYRATVEDVIQHYENGRTLYFGLIDFGSVINWWLQSISQELEWKRELIYASFFASKSESITEWHFDPNENFTIQLSGVKKWLIAPNSEEINPTYRYTSSQETDCSERIGLKKDVETVMLYPGDVLYLPRGYWHRVEAIDESLSLTLSLRPQTWSQIVLSLLEIKLNSDPYWRHNVWCLSKDSKYSELLNERLSKIQSIISLIQKNIQE